MMNEWIVSSSLLIGLVLLGRLLLRGKISLRLQYALWGVVLLRLLTPVQLFSHDLSAGTVAERVDISEPVRQVYVSANEDRYEREYDEAYRQVVAGYEAAREDYDPIAAEEQAREMAQSAIELDVTQLLYAVWLAGMAVMTAVIVGCNVHFIRRLRRRRWELPVSDCLLTVYVTEAVPTPCIFGFFRPAIYLTPGAARDDTVRSHVLQHELTHYRHGDHIWSVLRSVCLVLHWYNPLVWIAAKVSRADGELACDEGAMQRLGEGQRGDYGRTLIGLTCSAPVSELLLTATTMTGSAGSIRERIRLLMKRPKNTVLTLTAVILLVTLAVGCTFAGAPETTEPTETAPSGVDNDMSVTGEELPIPEEPDTGSLYVDYFNELLNPQFNQSKPDWIPRALTSFYDDPTQIDLYQLFYAGIIPGADNTPSAAELAFLEGQSAYNPEFDLVRIPGEEMDRVLSTYFGITLEETERIGLSNFLYNPENDCYYHSHTDTNINFRTVTACEELPDGSWRVLYTSDIGDGVVVLRLGEDNARIVSNHQRIARPLDARALTDEEVAQVRAGFTPNFYDEARGEGVANPLACFTHTMYADITEMSRSEFLAYFPTEEYATEEEFDLLKEKYPEFFGEWTWESMPIPIHRFDPALLDEVMMEYAGIHWDDVAEDRQLHYLEETGCCYNYTSDFGLMGFPCTGGWFYDGGAVLYSDRSTLILTEQDGHYYIQAHLPALIME